MESDSERRQAERISCDKPLWYSALGLIGRQVESEVVTGQGIDLSVDGSGIGLKCQAPLFTGELLRIVMDDGLRLAVVRWVHSAGAGYRAGALIV